MRYLQRQSEEYQRLVGGLLIKVTEFFRDAELFTFLRQRALPELVKHARESGRELRLWSAGTGEEAYSLAILVAELLGDELEEFQVRIFATDVDSDAVGFARRGVYPASALAAVPGELTARFFTDVGGEYEVRRSVRSLVVFGQHDLAQRAPFPHIDLVLCRNILIYFTTELQRRALQLFSFSLRDGGYLVLGKAETTGPLAESFAVEEPRLKVFRRQGSRVRIPPAWIREAPPAAVPLVTPPRRTPATLNEELQATNEKLETLNEELQATVEELNATNDDLQARSVELREMTVSLETQRRESDERRARLEAVLANMGDAVLVVHRDGQAELTNAAYERIFGGVDATIVMQDVQGRPLPPEAMPQQRAARGESFTMQFSIQAPDGTRREFDAIGQPVPGDGQEHGVVVIRDITERSLHRALEQFVVLASHELRTPLTLISGYLQTLTRMLTATGGDEQLQRYAALGLAQARRMSVLVQDLMDASRLQTGSFTLAREELDLRALVAGAVELARSLARDQTIQLEAEDAPLLVRGDEGRLEQVALNLLLNAITHAPQSERIDVRLRLADGEAELQVQDYGPGIPAANVPHLFSRFYRVGAASPGGGLGLGLYISKELVEAHGGSISVHSVEDKGATFTVRLPLANGETRARGHRSRRARAQ